MKLYCNMALIVFLNAAAIAAATADVSKSGMAATTITREQIEADWLRQRDVRKIGPVSSGKKVTVQQDAVGGGDGIKNGEW
jgi:hypothetical protein